MKHFIRTKFLRHFITFKLVSHFIIYENTELPFRFYVGLSEPLSFVLPRLFSTFPLSALWRLELENLEAEMEGQSKTQSVRFDPAKHVNCDSVFMFVYIGVCIHLC